MDGAVGDKHANAQFQIHWGSKLSKELLQEASLIDSTLDSKMWVLLHP